MKDNYQKYTNARIEERETIKQAKIKCVRTCLIARMERNTIIKDAVRKRKKITAYPDRKWREYIREVDHRAPYLEAKEARHQRKIMAEYYKQNPPKTYFVRVHAKR